MKYLKHFEDPNFINYNKNMIGWWVGEKNIAFSYYNGEFEYGEDYTHPQLYTKYLKRTHAENVPIKNGRGQMSGRLFVNEKIVTFWKFPENNEEMKKLSEDIKKHCDIDIWDDDWLVEIINEDYNWIYIPVKQYMNSDVRSEEEMNIVHNLPPEQKAKALKEKGYKFKEKHPIEFRHALGKFRGESMKYLKKFENPNAISVEIDGVKVDQEWKRDNCIAFTYYDDIYFSGRGTHSDIQSNALRYFYKKKHDWGFNDVMQNVENFDSYAGRGKYAGRLFKLEKVITFWDYPKSMKELKKVANDIKEKDGVDIFEGGWKIEIVDGVEDNNDWGNWEPSSSNNIKYIPIEEFETSGDRSEEEMKIVHNLPPEEKAKALKEKGYKFKEKHPIEFRHALGKYRGKSIITKFNKYEIS